MSEGQEFYQHARTGQVVELIAHHDKNYAMVKNSEGKILYVPLVDLHTYIPGKGRTGEQPKPLAAADAVDPEVIPTPSIPPDTRLNLNQATAEMISQRIKGIGYSTAKKIIELRGSLPGERFAAIKQLEDNIGRVNWEEIKKQDIFYIA